jgi:hypothetical protein
MELTSARMFLSFRRERPWGGAFLVFVSFFIFPRSCFSFFSRFVEPFCGNQWIPYLIFCSKTLASKTGRVMITDASVAGSIIRTDLSIG